MSMFQHAADASALFASAGASPALKPAAGCTSICSSGHGTPSQGPLKQPKHGAAAKCAGSPFASLDLDHTAEEPLLFQRAVSTASTEFTSPAAFYRFVSEDDATPFASPFVGSQRRSQEGLADLPEWRLQDAVAEGGCPFAEGLEESLAEVRALYEKKFGLDVDEEEDESLIEDADGTKWQVTEGTGLLSGLDDRLEDLKALYKRKFGLDVDEEEDESLFEDADGTKWQVTEGCGFLTGLEDWLEDLKALYKRKFGLDVDEDADDEAARGAA